MAGKNNRAPQTERERAAQAAYFSGREEAQEAPAGKAPFFARPIPPAVGVGAGLATAAVVVAALLLWPSGRRTPNITPAPMPSIPPPMFLVPDQMFVMTPTVKRLKDIQENAPFRADLSTINAVRWALYGDGPFRKPLTPAEQDRIVIETAPPSGNSLFQVVRKDGKFYLCAFTFGHIPEDVLKAGMERRAMMQPGGAARRPSGGFIGPATQVVLYNSAAAAHNAPSLAPVTMPVIPPGHLSAASAARRAVRPMPFTVDARGDGPEDGELTPILVPFDGIGNGYSSSTAQDRTALKIGIDRLDANAYEPWRPLPAASPGPGTPTLQSVFFAAAKAPALGSGPGADPRRPMSATPRPGEPEP
jgi:hypothetical protein